MNIPEPNGSQLDFEMLLHYSSDHENRKGDSLEITCPDAIDKLLCDNGLDLFIQSLDPQDKVFITTHNDESSVIFFRSEHKMKLWKVDCGARKDREGLAGYLREKMISIFGAKTFEID